MNQKMYWKKGFYDTQVEGAVAISVEYLQKLINGQSTGKQIVKNAEGYPILIEYMPSIDEVRAEKFAKLRGYDASDSS